MTASGFRVSLSLSTALLGAALAAQTVPEGYGAAPVALPGNANQPAVLPNGTAWFTGTELQWLEAGQPLRTLLGYPAPAFGAFTLPVGMRHLMSPVFRSYFTISDHGGPIAAIDPPSKFTVRNS